MSENDDARDERDEQRLNDHPDADRRGEADENQDTRERGEDNRHEHDRDDQDPVYEDDEAGSDYNEEDEE